MELLAGQIKLTLHLLLRYLNFCMHADLEI